jgi:hypothetical protein
MNAAALIALFKKTAAGLKALPDDWKKAAEVKKVTGAYVAKLTAVGVPHVEALLALHEAWMAA